MNEERTKKKNRGGRPKKEVCRDEQLSVMVTIGERKIIEEKVKLSGSDSNSEYLRELGLNGQVVTKTNPHLKEILVFTTVLNHVAANINQFAKKANRGDDFNVSELSELNLLVGEIRLLVTGIKNSLK